MILVLVGDFNPGSLKNSLERTFGIWKDAAELQLTTDQKVSLPEVAHCPSPDMRFAMDRNQVQLRLGRIIDPANMHEVFCLRLIEPYVYKKLYEIRESTGMFYGVKVDLVNDSGCHKGVGHLAFTLAPYHVDAALQATQEVLCAIAQEGIPEEALVAAKGIYHLQLAKRASRNKSLAYLYGMIFADYGSVVAYQHHIDTLSGITKEQIDAVARTFFNPDEWSVLKVGRVNEKTLLTRLWYKLKKGVRLVIEVTYKKIFCFIY